MIFGYELTVEWLEMIGSAYARHQNVNDFWASVLDAAYAEAMDEYRLSDKSQIRIDARLMVSNRSLISSGFFPRSPDIFFHPELGKGVFAWVTGVYGALEPFNVHVGRYLYHTDSSEVRSRLQVRGLVYQPLKVRELSARLEPLKSVPIRSAEFERKHLALPNGSRQPDELTNYWERVS